MPERTGSFGDYFIHRKLAEGGMAEIYLATQRGPEGFAKDVALKLIRPFLAENPDFVRMFKDEARLASRLNHANVVQVFDFGEHDATWYLAMEYVSGRSLRDLKQRARQLMVALPPVLVAQIGAQIARGLDHAHRATEGGRPLGLVHRDVSPHNVLLSFDGAVKLADFGIARARNKVSAPGTLKGKFRYMSPEQARGGSIDARSDVFALGVVLWEMLTGGRLFEGDSDLAVLRAVQNSVIASPARLNPAVSAALDGVVMRALERDVTARWQTAKELEQALGEIVLREAKSIEEIDVGGFLRRVWSAESAARETIRVPDEKIVSWIGKAVVEKPRPDVRAADSVDEAGKESASEIRHRRARWAVGLLVAASIGLFLFALLNVADRL